MDHETLDPAFGVVARRCAALEMTLAVVAIRLKKAPPEEVGQLLEKRTMHSLATLVAELAPGNMPAEHTKSLATLLERVRAVAKKRNTLFHSTQAWDGKATVPAIVLRSLKGDISPELAGHLTPRMVRDVAEEALRIDLDFFKWEAEAGLRPRHGAEGV